jgi:CHRD domain/PEP-CTERM motif
MRLSPAGYSAASLAAKRLMHTRGERMKSILIKAFAAFCLAVPAYASAAVLIFNSILTGLQEVPVTGSPTAVGSGSMIYDTDTNGFMLNVFGTGLSGAVVAAHIHVAPPGSPGPVIVPFALADITSLGAGTFSASHSGVFPEANEAALIAGGTYVNYHTALFPGGDLRGQLILVQAVPEPGTIGLLLAGLGLTALALRRRRT